MTTAAQLSDRELRNQRTELDARIDELHRLLGEGFPATDTEEVGAQINGLLSELAGVVAETRSRNLVTFDQAVVMVRTDAWVDLTQLRYLLNHQILAS